MLKIKSPMQAAARGLAGRAADAGGMVLAYHDVVEDMAGHNEWVVDQRSLRNHVIQLRRLGFRVVPLGTLVDALAAGDDATNMVAITFDDALVGVFDLAAPILAELDAPATVFVVSDAIGESPAWWPGSQPVMSDSSLDALASAGWTIGAHTRTHPSLPKLDAVAVRDEIDGCRRALQDRFGVPVDHLAYPFGHFDPTATIAARDAGFTAAFTFLNGRVAATDDRYRLPRLTMGTHMTGLRLGYHAARTSQSWPNHQLDEVLGDGATGYPGGPA